MPASTPRTRRRVQRRLHARTRFLADGRLLRLSLRRARVTLVPSLVSVLVIQGFSAVAVLPAMTWLFDCALAHAGLTNVTDRTLGVLLSDPTALLLTAACLALMLVDVVAQLAALLAIVLRHQRGAPITVRTILGDIGTALRRLLSPQTLPLACYLLAILPLSGLGAYAVVTQGVAIPPFVTREYLKSPGGIAVYTAIFGALLYVNARLIFTVPVMQVRSFGALAAMRESLRLTRHRTIVLTLLLALPAAAGALFSMGLDAVLVDAAALSVGGPGRVLTVFAGLAQCLGVLLLVVGLTAALHLMVDEVRREEDARTAVPPRPRPRVRQAAVGLVALGAMFAISLGSTPAALASPVGAAASSLVIAHRGDVWGGVENTLGALEAAAAEGADYVEMDVQLTADGVWVASHDTNLLMVAGVNKNISEMTAAEVTSTVVTQHGHSDTIPRMADYVTRAAELGIPLLIEVKINGAEYDGFIDDFLREITDLGADDGNIFHSLDADVVEQLKAARPDLTVGLTIALSIGGVPDSSADFFVIEQASFTDDFLAEAHESGREVYVWTVNNDDRIRELLRSGVDGIVTDQITNAQDARTDVAEGADAATAVHDALAG